MDWSSLSETVTCKDAGASPTDGFTACLRQAIPVHASVPTLISASAAFINRHDRAISSDTRREPTYTDVGNGDIAGANIRHPWGLDHRIHAVDGI